MKPRAGLIPLLTCAALAGCHERDVPRNLLDVVAPPPGLVAHCQDSLRHVRGPQLVCNASTPSAEWIVRLDGAGDVGTLTRYTRVAQAHVAAAVDSTRAAVQARLGEGEACRSGPLHYWQRAGWTTFLSVEGSDATPGAVADSSMNVVLAAAWDPDHSALPECED